MSETYWLDVNGRAPEWLLDAASAFGVRYKNQGDYGPALAFGVAAVAEENPHVTEIRRRYRAALLTPATQRRFRVQTLVPAHPCAVRQTRHRSPHHRATWDELMCLGLLLGPPEVTVPHLVGGHLTRPPAPAEPFEPQEQRANFQYHISDLSQPSCPRHAQPLVLAAATLPEAALFSELCREPLHHMASSRHRTARVAPSLWRAFKARCAAWNCRPVELLTAAARLIAAERKEAALTSGS